MLTVHEMHRLLRLKATPMVRARLLGEAEATRLRAFVRVVYGGVRS